MADEKLGRLNNLTQTLKELHNTYENMKVELKVQEDNISCTTVGQWRLEMKWTSFKRSYKMRKHRSRRESSSSEITDAC